MPPRNSESIVIDSSLQAATWGTLAAQVCTRREPRSSQVRRRLRSESAGCQVALHSELIPLQATNVARCARTRVELREDTPMRPLLLLAIVSALVAPTTVAADETGGFVVKLGTDTLSVERVVRTATQIR